MKAVKLTKKMLKMHPADLLVELGAYNKEKKRVYPSEVYLSKKDCKTLRNVLTKQAKKEYAYLSKNRLKSLIGMEWLNYGLNETLVDAIKPGYVLVDEDGIQKKNG